MTIGEKVKAFRVKHLLTLRDAAKLFGVSYAEVDRIEREKNKPHFITEAKWEKLLEKAEREVNG
jgi:transcriptional regulator with XRE-family HTH domain